MRIMDASSLKKIPPQNLEVEQVVLGSMLMLSDALLAGLENLQPGDFYRQSHKEIFTALSALFNENKNTDLITVADFLKSSGKLDMVGGPAYLATLTDCIPSAIRMPGYCEIIKNLSLRRQFISFSQEMADKCYNIENTKDIVDFVGQKFLELTTLRENKKTDIGSILNKVLKNIEKRVENNGVSGIRTGFYNLDCVLNISKKDLVIVAGRPGMGKTAMAMKIATNAAIEGLRVVVFSLEMGDENIVERQLSDLSSINSESLRRGIIQDDDWRKLTSACGKLSQLPIVVDDTPALTLTELRAKAKKYAIGQQVGMVIVDYLQLMRGQGENRNLEITNISGGLKALAKELDVPVIALSQLNRGVEARADKRPKASDLRESGSIEQDADIIMMVYRDEEYNKSEDNPLRGIAEIIIEKQRNGPKGTVRLGYDGRFTRFYNIP